ncbi:MAG: molybdopterin oxidoreductase, alpha subunit [Acidobacteria bacterium OLB17]|nr:MAG: molybdopterin oxidoreductase, alpha subunit [Acidobacteria bacterium OLB17]
MKDKLWKQFIDDDERGLPVLQNGISRRTFLEAIGYTTAAIALTSCATPEQKVIPYLKQPPELMPGVASWYASTCGGCSAGCGLLVKVRDGRPIKVEGNPEHPVNRGGLCPVAHSLVFGLYDAERLQQPLAGGKPSTWEEADKQIIEKLKAIAASGGKVRLLSNSITGPTSRKVINKFLSQFKDAKHIVYEPVSTAAIRAAHLRTHGVECIPAFRIEDARLIVSLGADFLGTWISPTAFTRSFSQAREVNVRKERMLRHIQFESRLSMTGANADKRVTISPAEEAEAILLLAKLVSARSGATGASETIDGFEPRRLSEKAKAAVAKCADELIGAKGASLVICGSNNIDKQQAVSFINQALGNYGKTIAIPAGNTQNFGRDEDMQTLIAEMKDGSVEALIVLNANPVYDHFSGSEVANAIGRVPLKISLSPVLDETASLADLACPTHHSLESWDDAEPISGVFSTTQPTIAPLFGTRAYQESLMRWSGDSRSFYDALRSEWQAGPFAEQTDVKAFDGFWDKSIHDGVFVSPKADASQPAFKADGLNDAAARLAGRGSSAGSLTAVLYPKVTIRDGRFANNPWLHEIPDPITKNDLGQLRLHVAECGIKGRCSRRPGRPS